MLQHTVVLSLLLFGLGGCADRSPPVDGQRSAPATDRARKGSVLKKPIGIATVGGEFTPLVQAGQRLPYTFSETFTNKTDGGPEALVSLSQQDESGIETVAALIIPIPRVPDNSLQITVTLKITADKRMKVKTTVVQTATRKEFGPFLVE